MPLIQAPLLGDSTLFVVPIGLIPPSGTLTLPTVVPAIGGQAQRFFVQVLAIDLVAVAAYGGSGVALSLLSAAF